MASKGQLQIVGGKVDILEQQRHDFHRAVDEYLDQVTEAVSAGRSWVENQGRSGPSFLDICSTLDICAASVVDKTADISAGLGKDKTDSDEFTTYQDQPAPSATPDSATAMTTSMLPPASSSSSSYHPLRSSSLLADNLLLKLQERVEILETELTSMSETVDELGGVKTEMEDMKTKVKQCEESNSKVQGKLTTLKTRFEGLLEQFNTSSEEYTTNKENDAKWCKKIDGKISGLNEEVRLLRDDVKEVEKRVEKSEKKFGTMNKQVSSVEDRLNELEEEKEKAVSRVRRMEEKLETCQAKFGKVEELDERISCVEEERRGKDREEMNDLEERLQHLEEERMGVEIQKMGIFEDRLLGLEEERRNDIKEITTIKTDFSTISSLVDSIKKKQERAAVGFTATVPGLGITTISDGTVTKFTNGAALALKSSEGDVPTVSTSVMKAPGGAKGAAVRRSFTTQPGTSCEGNCLITISSATPKGSDQLNKKEPPKKQEQIKPNVDSLKPIARPDPHNSDAFDIFVKNMDGKVHTFSVKRNDSVDSLLLEVQKRLMLCQDQFWLNCNSKKLQRGHTLEEYRVVKHSTVYLLMPLVGGRM